MDFTLHVLCNDSVKKVRLLRVQMDLKINQFIAHAHK